jgi:hypothetical protein
MMNILWAFTFDTDSRSLGSIFQFMVLILAYYGLNSRRSKADTVTLPLKMP